MALRAVQYHPKFCPEAKADLDDNGTKHLERFDTSHDLSVIDDAGERHKVGTFKHAEWASEIGKLVEEHGLTGLNK